MTKHIAVVTALLTTGGGDRLLESIYTRFVERGYKVTIYVLYPSKYTGDLNRTGITIKTPPLVLYPLFRVLRLRRIFEPLFHSILECRIRSDHNRSHFAWVMMYHFGTYPLLGLLKNFMGCPIYYTEISSPRGRTVVSSINGFDKVFVPSATIGRELEVVEGLKNGYTVVPFFVDLKEKPPIPAHLHVPEPTVGIIARLSPEKNIEFLIRAMATVKTKNKSIRLLIVGAGHDEAKLKSLVAELGLINEVRFVQSFTSLTAIMKQIDVIALCSKIEGMPLTLIEAMAYGKPVLSTPVGSVHEMIKDGYNGFKVSTHVGFVSALRLIVEPHPSIMYDFMSKKAREHYEQYYDPDKVFPKLLAACEPQDI